MRITRDTLLRLAREAAQKHALSDRGLVAAYLTGSLLGDDPFLGNAADIDIVLVHPEKPKIEREIVALTAEVHLDIRHNSRSEYDNPKELRLHPILGPELYDPLPLYVTRHFFEYVQAAVRDKFNDPENVLERARREAAYARQAWAEIRIEGTPLPDLVLAYLKAVELAANAIALLSGGPLAERRLLLQFPQRAEAAGLPGLSVRLLDLLCGGEADPAVLAGFIPDWEKSFSEATGRPHADVRLAAPRLGYYKLAFEALLSGDRSTAVLWPLLLTWSLAARVLPPTRQSAWLAACSRLGLSSEGLPSRMQSLDAFLDTVEEVQEGFASGNT